MFPFFTPGTNRKNKRVSAVFKGCRKGTFAWNWLTTDYLFCFSVSILLFSCFFANYPKDQVYPGMKLYLGSSIWMRYMIPLFQSKFHADPNIKMCLGSHRKRKKLDYQFTIICYFSRSRMRSFSIYLACQMVTSP